MSSSDNNLWIIGVVLIITGSLATNLGTNLVSQDHKRIKDKRESCVSTASNFIETTEVKNDNGESSPNEQATSKTISSGKKSDETEGSSLRRRVGTISFILGNLTIFAAFGFAAQSLLASLESVQFISNIFFARYLHNEKITYRILISTFAIICGNVLVIVFAEHSESLLNSRAVIHLYLTNIGYHAYLIVAGLSFFFFHCLFAKYHESRTIKNQILWRHDFIEPLAFSISSTLIGTQAVLNAKCMSMFIQVSARGSAQANEFEKPTIWVILGIWILLVWYWLKRLDLGLALFPPTFIIPVLQVFYMFFAIICGGIFFLEFSHFNTAKAIGFTFGVILILGGVYGLAPTNSINSTTNKVSEQLVNQVVQQFEEVPETLAWFRRRLDERLSKTSIHPVSELLRQEVTRKSSTDVQNLSPALQRFRRLSRTVEEEHAALEVFRYQIEVEEEKEYERRKSFSNNLYMTTTQFPHLGSDSNSTDDGRGGEHDDRRQYDFSSSLYAQSTLTNNKNIRDDYKTDYNSNNNNNNNDDDYDYLPCKKYTRNSTIHSSASSSDSQYSPDSHIIDILDKHKSNITTTADTSTMTNNSKNIHNNSYNLINNRASDETATVTVTDSNSKHTNAMSSTSEVDSWNSRLEDIKDLSAETETDEEECFSNTHSSNCTSPQNSTNNNHSNNSNNIGGGITKKDYRLSGRSGSFIANSQFKDMYMFVSDKGENNSDDADADNNTTTEDYIKKEEANRNSNDKYLDDVITKKIKEKPLHQSTIHPHKVLIINTDNDNNNDHTTNHTTDTDMSNSNINYDESVNIINK